MKKLILVTLLSVAGLYGMEGTSDENDSRFDEIRSCVPWYWVSCAESNPPRRKDCWFMFEVAVEQNSPYALEKMFGAGLRMGERNKRRETFLHIAMGMLLTTKRRQSVVDNIIYLIDRGCDIGAQNSDGDNPWASARKQVCSQGGADSSMRPALVQITDKVKSVAITQYQQRGESCFICNESGQRSEELGVLDPACLRVACRTCWDKPSEETAIVRCPTCKELQASVRSHAACWNKPNLSGEISVNACASCREFLIFLHAQRHS